jgi:hypothetical protein
MMMLQRSRDCLDDGVTIIGVPVHAHKVLGERDELFGFGDRQDTSSYSRQGEL